ncbi:MAG: MFS transporter [Patescibacteria group bacterium]|nr:MFS transporter [Patescibacteria group bacterium]
MRNGIHLKKLILWILYDFANSFAFITFFLYYSQWLVVDRGISDFWFNMTFVGSSLLFILTVPVASLIIDKIKIRIPGLRVVTILAIVFFAATALIALFAPDYYIISIITLSFAEYFYLFSFTFYNPLLREVATPEKQGLASGWGQFGNWIGEITGLLVAIPFATGAITLLGGAGRAQTLLPATILFTIFAIPLLLFFKEESKKIETKINIASEYKNVFRSFINLCKSPGVGLFFLSYFFFNDAVTTASNNFPIYVEAVFGSSDNIKSYLLIGILISSAISAPISGWIADKVGLRKTLWWVLGGWAIIFPAMAITTNFTVFVAVCIAMGLWFGSIWTVTRAYLLQLTPPEMITQSFTYYTLMERLATLVGPISWGLVVASLPTSGAFNYRMAAMVMALLVIIGLFFARKLPKTKTEMKSI